MRKILFAELILCAILLFTAITVAFREETRIAEAGAFGTTCYSNDTFEDMSGNLLGEIFS